MPRVRKGAARNKARKKLLKAARGYWGTKSRHKQQAKVALTRAGQATITISIVQVIVAKVVGLVTKHNPLQCGMQFEIKVSCSLL